MWKTDTGFVSIFNNCYSWDLSQVCLVLIPVLNHIYPRAKSVWKTKKEKLFTCWDCEASSRWVQNLHQFGCQKCSVRAAAHYHPREQRGQKLKLGGARSQSLCIGQAAFCSSDQDENISLHFKGDNFFSIQFSYLTKTQSAHTFSKSKAQCCHFNAHLLP